MNYPSLDQLTREKSAELASDFGRKRLVLNISTDETLGFEYLQDDSLKKLNLVEREDAPKCRLTLVFN